MEERMDKIVESLSRRNIEAEVRRDPLGTEMILNVGPQHPATHGVLRLVLKLDGEYIVDAVPELGYLHRGKEKIAENMTFLHTFENFLKRVKSDGYHPIAEKRIPSLFAKSSSFPLKCNLYFQSNLIPLFSNLIHHAKKQLTMAQMDCYAAI